MLGKRLINTKVAGGGGGCTDIVDNYDPFGGNGVALYQLNGDATDVSGNYNGTATDVTYGAGQFGQAGVFNGSTSVVSLGNVFNSTLSNNFTISAWVNVNSMGGQIFGKGLWATGGEYVRLYTRTSTPRIQFGFEDGSGNNVFMSSNSENLEGTGWRHIVAVGDYSGSFSLYLDGQNIESQTVNGSMNMTNTSQAYIGNRDFNFAPVNGSIDQVRIFNTALTPLEVEALYTEELCICDGTVDTLDILGDGSCIATYQLDGNANDLSGNYSGTPTDVSYGVGEFDLAGVFNGSSSYINLNGSVISVGSFGVSLWVNWNDVTNQSRAFHLGNGDDFSDISIFAISGNAVVRFADSGSNYRDVSFPVSTNQWYHIAMTYDISNNNYKVFLNGVQQGSTIVASGFTTLGNYGAIGARINSGGISLPMRGSIDQVRIFNKALSAGEVTTLYNETACTKAACTGTTNTLDILGDGSCIATYPLDGSPLDLSGNYNGVQTDVTYPQGYFDLAGSFKALQGNIITPVGIYNNSFSGHSISFWMYSGGTNYETPIWGHTGASAAAGWQIRTNTGGNGINCGFKNSAGSNILSFGTLSSTFTNGWHHVVASWDGTTSSNGAKLYVDNVLIGQATSSETLASQTFTLGATLGADRQSAGRSIQGLDQVRFFNRELNSAEVTTLYNETPCN